MLRIAICDDDRIVLEKLKNYFEKLNDSVIQYEVYYDAEMLYRCIETQESKFNVFILDIEMQEMNGIELARKIRREDSNSLIVFLTSHSEYVFDAFDVITFDFLRKPLEYSKFQNLIERIKRYFKVSKKQFTFSYRTNSFAILFENIFYIKKTGRRACLYTKDKEYIFNMTLDDIWKQLDSALFVSIYPSCIVNLSYVREIVREELMLKNGEKLFIGKKYCREVKKQHLRFIREKN